MRHHSVLPETMTLPNLSKMSRDNPSRYGIKQNSLHLRRRLFVATHSAQAVNNCLSCTFAISVVGAPVWRLRGRERQGRVNPFAVGLVQRGGEVRQRGRQLHEHVRRQPGHHRSSSDQRPLAHVPLITALLKARRGR